MTDPYSKDRKNQPTRLPDVVNKVFLKPGDIFMRHTYSHVLGVEDQ